MQNAKLRGAWFNLTLMIGAKLARADLSGSTFLGTDLTGVNLAYAKLNGAMLIGANLSGADLRGADLSGAILTLAFPEGTSVDYYQSLAGEELLLALGETSVIKAFYDPFVLELNEVRLKTTLQDAILQGVLYNNRTIWPEGFELPPSVIFEGTE